MDVPALNHKGAPPYPHLLLEVFGSTRTERTSTAKFQKRNHVL